MGIEDGPSFIHAIHGRSSPPESGQNRPLVPICHTACCSAASAASRLTVKSCSGSFRADLCLTALTQKPSTLRWMRILPLAPR
jgi:hypothetical protein